MTLLDIFIWFALTIATERATRIIVDAKISEPFRAYIGKLAYPNNKPPTTDVQKFLIWLHSLLTCGYCMSVWVGFFFALFAPRYFECWLAHWLVAGLLLHGLAGFWHRFYIYACLGQNIMVTWNSRLVQIVNAVDDENKEINDGSTGQSAGTASPETTS